MKVGTRKSLGSKVLTVRQSRDRLDQIPIRMIGIFMTELGLLKAEIEAAQYDVADDASRLKDGSSIPESVIKHIVRSEEERPLC